MSLLTGDNFFEYPSNCLTDHKTMGQEHKVNLNRMERTEIVPADTQDLEQFLCSTCDKSCNNKKHLQRHTISGEHDGNKTQNFKNARH